MKAEHTTTDPPPDRAQLVEINEALLLGSVRQHELRETAEGLNDLLEAEILERKQVETELRQSEERYHTLFDSGPVAVYSCAASGEIQNFNRRAVELWGREPVLGDTGEQFCGSFKLFRPDGSFMRHEQCPMAEVLSGRLAEVRDGEVHIEHPDGSRAIVVVNIHPLKNPLGVITGAINCFYDVTERKLAEEALRESQRFLRSSLDALSGHVAILDETGIILEVNEAWRRFADANEFPGADYGVGASYLQNCEQSLPQGNDGQECANGISDVSAGRRTSYEMEYPCHSPTEQRWYVMRVTRFQSPGPVRIVIVHDNCTERKLAEEALRASEEQFASLFQQTTGGIAQADLGGRFTMVNDRYCQLVGRSREVLLEMRIKDVTHPEDVSASLEKIAAMIAGMLPSFVIEKRYVRPDGSTVWVQADVAPICDAAGRVRAIAATVTDITERHLLEESLVARADDLARADRSKDEFLAMLAHELRNPLAPLCNAAEILRTDGASTEACALAQGILTRQIENMSQMIDDLLDVSRITEGKIELRLQVVALADVVSAAVSLARPGIEARGQELEITLPAEPVFLHGDNTRLDQVFGNLLTNACKYSGSGCHIAITAERAAEAPEVIVRVRDDGIGMAPEFLPRIFDLFVQATRSLDRANGGLGIGLTLVQRLVKLHGGSIEAHSPGLGHGSEFIVRLPVITTTAALAPPSAVPASDRARRMLIVDDNADSARSMATLQSLRGHATCTAFTGPEALAAAAEFVPDVVLLDIGLPSMGGYEVARQLRAMPALAGAFLVAMSGYGSGEDRARARLAGFDEYLVKPADHNLLRTWMRGRP